MPFLMLENRCAFIVQPELLCIQGEGHMEKVIRQRRRGRTKYVALAIAFIAVAAVAVA